MERLLEAYELQAQVLFATSKINPLIRLRVKVLKMVEVISNKATVAVICGLLLA